MSQLLRSHPPTPPSSCGSLILCPPPPLSLSSRPSSSLHPSPFLPNPRSRHGEKLVGALLISGRARQVSPHRVTVTSVEVGRLSGSMVARNGAPLRFRCVHGNIPHLRQRSSLPLRQNSPKNREL